MVAHYLLFCLEPVPFASKLHTFFLTLYTKVKKCFCRHFFTFVYNVWGGYLFIYLFILFIVDFLTLMLSDLENRFKPVFSRF